MPADSTTSPDFGPSTLPIQSQGTTDTRSPTRVRSGTQAQWEKLCPRCNEWVGLGVKGNLYPFRLHQDGKQCRDRMRIRTEEPHAAGLSVASVSFGPGSPPTHSTSPIPAYTHISMPELPLDRHPHNPEPFSQPVIPDSGVPVAVASTSLSPTSYLPSPILPQQTPCIPPAAPDAMVVDSPQAARPSLNIPPTFPSIASHPPQEQAVLVRSRSRCDGSMLRRSGKVGAWSPSENVPL